MHTVNETRPGIVVSVDSRHPTLHRMVTDLA